MSAPHWKSAEPLVRFLKGSKNAIDIVGSDSPVYLAGLLLDDRIRWSKNPHLIVVADVDAAETLIASLQFFDPKISAHVLTGFDVGLFSGLYPSHRLTAGRLGWLWKAAHAKPGDIFIAPIEHLLQKTIPYSELSSREFSLKKNDLLLENFAETLNGWGYTQTPLVEDVGTFSVRGGIVDVFSPAHDQPVRLELFGDVIDSVKFFDPVTQRSDQDCSNYAVIPPQEIQFTIEARQSASKYFQETLGDRDLPEEEVQNFRQHLARGLYLSGMEFLLPGFYPKLDLPIEHFSSELNVWWLDSIEVARKADEHFRQMKQDLELGETLLIKPALTDVYSSLDELEFPENSKKISLSKIRIEDQAHDQNEDLEASVLPVATSSMEEIANQIKSFSGNATDLSTFLKSKIKEWKTLGHTVCFSLSTSNQAERLKVLLERVDLQPVLVSEDQVFEWENFKKEQADTDKVHLLVRSIPKSLRATDEHLILLREADLFGRVAKKKTSKKKDGVSDDSKAFALNFADLKPGDLIVHKLHGVGIYEGLKVMPIQGIDAEFIQLKYKGNDRLYLPVYRIHQIHKYSGPSSPALVDKLGGTSWEKTKTKVRSHLRDIASELLEIYAKRKVATRPAFHAPDADFKAFESAFPYDETEDQLKAINDIISDLQTQSPMDRLVCGDVGFGKTEVAMRAAFKVAQDRKQVAVIAPTTVLTFQHLETFQKRFKGWPLVIRSLNRFVSKSEQKKTLEELKNGQVDILIGTHRLLSQDVQFKDLGLLIVDEEQRFGVKHKEKLRKLRAHLDTLAMSATPIPRTLNLSLVGVRDLSLINTPPVDRLPTRTFVCKFDRETIRKAVESEISRGGQVYFIHNRVQSIYALAEELREILPNVKMRVAHGQMEEGQLEKAMVEFFHHEVDVLLCTTIVESGMDVPKANTMFIDKAHQLGLSQLYQLRGRVGRSKERAYCYLLVPQNQKLEKDAQERLRIIQENSALGSGIRIAQYDLELRGAGDILGESQAGHINAVGYELYLELLEEAVHKARGEDVIDVELEPEINLRIPALIPDQYISDLRVRLAYYKALAAIESPDDLDRIEEELRDQFGKPPEPVFNLMGLMLIRKQCRDLGVRDLSAGKVGLALAFTDRTPLSPEKAIELTARANKKYGITPDSRLTIRMNEISWPRVMEELEYLLTYKNT